jgi:hypothetical protein
MILDSIFFHSRSLSLSLFIFSGANVRADTGVDPPTMKISGNNFFYKYQVYIVSIPTHTLSLYLSLSLSSVHRLRCRMERIKFVRDLYLIIFRGNDFMHRVYFNIRNDFVVDAPVS